MKLQKLSLLIFSAVCLASCSLNWKNIISVEDAQSSENNFDLDPTTDITNDTSSNDYDQKEIDDTEIEVPDQFDGTNVSAINESGDYSFSGEINPIEIKNGKEVNLFFDGVTINTSTAVALASGKNSKVNIILQNGSTNTIINDMDDTNAVHFKGEAHISGNGTLNIESKQKNGLKSKALTIVGENVKLNVTGANHAISCENLTVSKSTINVSSQKDGFHIEYEDATQFMSDQGYGYFVDANVIADTYGDAIQASSYIYISRGKFNLTTHGQFVSYSTSNKTTYELENDDFKFIKSGSTYKRVAKDEIRSLNSSYYALAESVKGLKAGAFEDSSGNDITTGDYEICIAHLAQVTVNSTDDCIHTNYGKVTLDSCNLDFNTFDDGIHADYNLDVNNASIKITSSYEGLEGANVTISGKNTNIVSYSSDDGINAASDFVSSTNITINDGYLRIYANGDGVDANTALYFKGGTTIVEGPGSGNGSLDAEQIYFQGGIVFACSTSGMQEKMTATQNTFVYQGSTMASNKLISITDSSNNELFSYTLKQSCNQIIFSHSSLQIGSSYNINGDGSKISTISMTSSLTKVGTSSGGGGGGQPPGGGHGW